MKRVAIVTIESHNYGNRLQNYALQQILYSMGYSTETLRRNVPPKGIKAYLRQIIQDVLQTKGAKFRQFDSNIFFSDIQIGRDDFPEGLNKRFDHFVVGSDQVWNPQFCFVAGKCDFLAFADNNQKISYAASFGVSEIPSERREEYAEYLRSFKAISVRENQGAGIVADLCGREAEILADPTMLLGPEAWRNVSNKPKGAKEKYILTYFLSPKCDAAKEKLEEIKGTRDVYELMDHNDKVAGRAGPAEFLWLFDHAEMILTDSFHACVFSFLFNKPFLVYDRNWNAGNMNSRLETLLEKFHLERKYAKSDLENDIWEHDYTEGYCELALEREKSLDFLKKALED